MESDRSALSFEGRLVEETAARIFADLPQSLFEVVESGGWPAEAWEMLESAGLPLALAPEEAGGHDLPLADGLAIVRLCGQACLPLPLPETMVANWLLSRAGMNPGSGPKTFAGEAANLVRTGDHWTASGRLRRVPWARHCETIVVACVGSNPHLLRLMPGTVLVTPGTNVAGEPRDDVTLDLTLADESVAQFEITPAQLRLFGAAMRTLQMAGALDEILLMTRAHVLERNQFGKPLGAFQVIQHAVARLASETAAANVAADLAIEALASGFSWRAIASAKARAGETASIAAGIAHQIHGAMGFTHEFRLHRLVRRLWSWRDEFGGEAEWNQALGQALMSAGADRLWEQLTGI